MSLLLDALRKSEAQRRRGQAPALDLSAAVPSSGAGRSPRRVAIAAGVVLAVLIAAAALWAWRSGWPVGEPAPAPGEPAVPPVAANRSGPSPEEAATAPAAPAGTVAAAREQQPPQQSAPPAADDSDSPAPQADAGASERQAPRDRSIAEAESGAESGAGAGAAADPRPESTSQSVPRSTPESAPESAPGPDAATDDAARSPQGGADESSESPAEPAPASPAAPSGEAARSPGDGLANYVHPWELPQAQRARFPKLGLTLHYYASEPADRFVLLNGERYREGDRVQGGVKVHEIRRNGVLVEFGDYLVLIE